MRYTKKFIAWGLCGAVTLSCVWAMDKGPVMQQNFSGQGLDATAHHQREGSGNSGLSATVRETQLPAAIVAAQDASGVGGNQQPQVNNDQRLCTCCRLDHDCTCCPTCACPRQGCVGRLISLIRKLSCNCCCFCCVLTDANRSENQPDDDS